MILMVMLNQSIQEHPLLLLGLFYQHLTMTGVLTHESFGMIHFDWSGGKTKKGMMKTIQMTMQCLLRMHVKSHMINFSYKSKFRFFPTLTVY